MPPPQWLPPQVHPERLSQQFRHRIGLPLTKLAHDAITFRPPAFHRQLDTLSSALERVIDATEEVEKKRRSGRTWVDSLALSVASSVAQWKRGLLPGSSGGNDSENEDIAAHDLRTLAEGMQEEVGGLGIWLNEIGYEDGLPPSLSAKAREIEMRIVEPLRRWKIRYHMGDGDDEVGFHGYVGVLREIANRIDTELEGVYQLFASMDARTPSSSSHSNKSVRSLARNSSVIRTVPRAGSEGDRERDEIQMLDNDEKVETDSLAWDVDGEDEELTRGRSRSPRWGITSASNATRERRKAKGIGEKKTKTKKGFFGFGFTGSGFESPGYSTPGDAGTEDVKPKGSPEKTNETQETMSDPSKSATELESGAEIPLARGGENGRSRSGVVRCDNVEESQTNPMPEVPRKHIDDNPVLSANEAPQGGMTTEAKVEEARSASPPLLPRPDRDIPQIIIVTEDDDEHSKSPNHSDHSSNIHKYVVTSDGVRQEPQDAVVLAMEHGIAPYDTPDPRHIAEEPQRDMIVVEEDDTGDEFPVDQPYFHHKHTASPTATRKDHASHAAILYEEPKTPGVMVRYQAPSEFPGLYEEYGPELEPRSSSEIVAPRGMDMIVVDEDEDDGDSMTRTYYGYKSRYSPEPAREAESHASMHNAHPFHEEDIYSTTSRERDPSSGKIEEAHVLPRNNEDSAAGDEFKQTNDHQDETEPAQHPSSRKNGETIRMEEPTDPSSEEEIKLGTITSVEDGGGKIKGSIAGAVYEHPASTHEHLPVCASEMLAPDENGIFATIPETENPVDAPLVAAPASPSQTLPNEAAQHEPSGMVVTEQVDSPNRDPNHISSSIQPALEVHSTLASPVQAASVPLPEEPFEDESVALRNPKECSENSAQPTRSKTSPPPAENAAASIPTSPVATYSGLGIKPRASSRGGFGIAPFISASVAAAPSIVVASGDEVIMPEAEAKTQAVQVISAIEEHANSDGTDNVGEGASERNSSAELVGDTADGAGSNVPKVVVNGGNGENASVMVGTKDTDIAAANLAAASDGDDDAKSQAGLEVTTKPEFRLLSDDEDAGAGDDETFTLMDEDKTFTVDPISAGNGKVGNGAEGSMNGSE
ncbi:hypothetical protein MKZ38_001032 [Zalerion maritima]|uniref:Uncharacterized protein n=1 Tax=Zalerion maritima TaxID=339359 RepID=A0AAD5RQS8_9PEZI|nr:hypothetical protein MKZ38_001032 [Zalerion maritima]